MAQLQDSLVIDWTQCSLVEAVPGKVSGVPILKGTRMPADAIVENYQSGLSAEEIADVFELPADAVQALLAYAARQNPSVRP